MPDKTANKQNASVRKTLSNTTLCAEMRPFGTLAEVMRIKGINYLELMRGIAHMTLEPIINEHEQGRKEGVLHIGELIQIRSQVQYEKYKEHVEHVEQNFPWDFEEIRQRAVEVSQGLFSGTIISQTTATSSPH